MINITRILRLSVTVPKRSLVNQKSNIHLSIVNRSTPIMNNYKNTDKISEKYKKNNLKGDHSKHTYLYMYHCLPIKPIKKNEKK